MIWAMDAKMHLQENELLKLIDINYIGWHYKKKKI